MLYWPLYEMHLSDAKMRDVWSESHTIASWLRVEQTLAEQQAKLQLISKSTAAALAAVVLDDLDRDALINDMQLTGRPIVGLVKQLREKVPLESQHEVHYGTTTQDIMDSATILQMKEGISLIIERLEAIKTQLVGFEIQHDSDSVMARTNGQYAMPIGLPQKFQVWRHELDRRQVAIETSAKRGLLLQLGGPVGDLHLMGQKGDALKSNVAKSLGLETATLHWQNSRDALAEIISSMGLLCTSLLKIGHNINLLSSSDIAEFNESNRSGWGSSSVMHHKRNQRCSEFATPVLQGLQNTLFCPKKRLLK